MRPTEIQLVPRVFDMLFQSFTGAVDRRISGSADPPVAEAEPRRSFYYPRIVLLGWAIYGHPPSVSRLCRAKPLKYMQLWQSPRFQLMEHYAAQRVSSIVAIMLVLRQIHWRHHYPYRIMPISGLNLTCDIPIEFVFFGMSRRSPRLNCPTRPDKRVNNGCAAGHYPTYVTVTICTDYVGFWVSVSERRGYL